MTSKKILDLQGVISPLNLLKCKSILKSMGEGELVEVILADEDVAENLVKIIHRSDDELCYRRNREDSIRIGIKKRTRLNK